MLPEDMRNYKTPDAFQLFTPRQAAIGLLIILLLVTIFEGV